VNGSPGIAAALVVGLLAQGPARPPVVVRTFDVASWGSTVLLGRTSDLAVWDVSDPDRPVERQHLALPAAIHAIAVDGDRAYLAAGSHGLYVIDIEGPDEKPAIVGRFDTPGITRDVLVRDGRVLLADDRYGIRVIDVHSSPSRPRQLALVPTRDEVVALADDGTMIASAEGRAGVRLWRLDDGAAPRETDQLTDVKDARDVALSAGLVLVAAAGEGLVVFRTTDDGSAVRIASLALDERAEHVAAANDVAWVSSGTPEIERIDLSDPEHPTRLEPIRLHRSAPVGRVTIEPGRLLAAVDTAGLGLVDLSRPDVPAVLLPRERTLRITQ
jgi:hypothetical protein